MAGEVGAVRALAGPVGPGRVRRRRSWTIEQKLSIVAEAKSSGDPIAMVARRHGMNSNHLFNWMQRARDGTLDRRSLYGAPGGALDFIELGVVGRCAEPAASTAGPIEIELPTGVRVRVGPGTAGEDLRRALAAVKAEL
jgi:transposase